MTFSIAARCQRTGQFAVAIAAASPAIAARCAFARAGVGAVTTQNFADPRLGPLGLDLLAGGLSADAACAELQARAGHIEYRQFTLVDAQGRTAVFSGAQTLGRHAEAQGRDVVAAGNRLAGHPDGAEIQNRVVIFQVAGGIVMNAVRVRRKLQSAGGQAGFLPQLAARRLFRGFAQALRAAGQAPCAACRRAPAPDQNDLGAGRQRA